MKLLGKWDYQFSLFAKDNTEFHKVLDEIRTEFADNIISYDTIIVFNQAAPTTEHDHQYLVMYSCEFVQDLLYRTIGQDIFFRAVLVYDRFSYKKYQNLEAFFGLGLTNAYKTEKEIQCCGLVISAECQKYNQIFPTTPYSQVFSFVYLNQSLERLNENTKGVLPTESFLFEQTAEYWRIYWDIKMLEKIYKQTFNCQDKKACHKHMATWNYYSRRYKGVLDVLVKNDFDPKSICPNYNWDNEIKNYNSEIRQF